MRIIQHFNIKKEKVLEHEEIMSQKIKSISISIPYMINIYYSNENKIVFNLDRTLVDFQIKDEILILKKNINAARNLNKEKSVDIYINKDIQNLVLKGQTIFVDNDFGKYDNIKIYDDVELIINDFKKDELILSAVDNSSVLLKATENVEYLTLKAQSNAKIEAKNAEAINLTTFTSGMSSIHARTNTTVKAELISMSHQYIYGEPQVVDKKISDIGAFVIVED